MPLPCYVCWPLDSGETSIQCHTRGPCESTMSLKFNTGIDISEHIVLSLNPKDSQISMKIEIPS